MTEQEEKEQAKKNREQLLIALALLMYPKVDERTLTVETIPEDVRTELEEKIDSYVKKEGGAAEQAEAEELAQMTKSEILTAAKEISGVKSQYFQVVTVGDAKTCDNCRKWDGRVISDDDAAYPSYSDFEGSGACHPNCRCFLKPVTINKLSMNSEPEISDAVEAERNPVTVDTTVDNGETEVQIATIGTVVGSDVEGKPVEQNFTEEALQKIADNTTEEILVDAEHSSEKGGTTEAKGWLSKLSFIPGKGLFGSIKWTDIGRRLVENRVFRWLSPSWLIDKATREPVAMTSVALTNKPSQMGRIDPIINQEPIKETIHMDMTKEELVSLIKDTLVAMNSCSEKKDEEEVKNEATEEKTDETATEETKTDVCNETTAEGEEKAETPEQPAAEVEPEVKVEEKVEEKEEIIKEEALNSAPTIGADVAIEPEWKKLNYREFLDWYGKNGRNCR